MSALIAELSCVKGTYTPAPGPNDNKPVGCLTWFTAFAFCAWDGGRLPTEAELSFAATGGNEQRVYPWSSPPANDIVDGTFAVFNANAPRAVGTTPKGNGRWGHADLSGNIGEWAYDWLSDAMPKPCTDCVQTSEQSYRVRTSGFDENAFVGKNDYRAGSTAGITYGRLGARCARAK
jgi:formylglycine-generating enzyme